MSDAATGRAALRACGHALLRGAVPPAMVAKIAGPVAAHSGARGFGGFRQGADARGSARLETVPASIRAFVCSPLLGRIAARALGVPAVRMLNFAGFLKRTGAGTPWHQDLSHIPLDRDAVVTLWLPLVALSADMAPLTFAQGSHLAGAIDLADLPARYPIVANPAMAPGDVSLHHGWVAHCSAPNAGERTRAAIAIAYFADGLRLRGDPAETPVMADLAAGAFPGLRGGDPARGAGTPIVWCDDDPPAIHGDQP